MKKTLTVALCAAGGVMVGAFANQLKSSIGAVCFTIGFIMLVLSALLNNKKN